MSRSQRFVGVTVALFALVSPMRAAENRVRIFPTQGIGITNVSEEPDGMLWISSADGVYRFDGLHFQKAPGIPASDITDIAFTSDGSMWIASPQGLLRVRGGLREDAEVETVLSDPAENIESVGDAVFVTTRKATFRIPIDGPPERLEGRFLPIFVDGKLWYLAHQQIRQLDPSGARVGQTVELPAHLQVVGRSAVAPDRDGNLWVGGGSMAIKISGGAYAETLARTYPPNTADFASITSGRNGQVWFLGDTLQGLSPPLTFTYPRNPAQAVKNAAEDRRGNLWFSVDDRGFMEAIRDPEWETWEVAGISTSQFARSGDRILLGAHDSPLLTLNSFGEWVALTDSFEADYYNLFPMQDGTLLAAGKTIGLAHLSETGKLLQKIRYPPIDPEKDTLYDDFREILEDAEGRIWIGNKRMLFRLTGQPGSFSLERVQLPGTNLYDHAVDLELGPDGRVWVGYESGLAWYDGSEWHRIATDKLINSVRSFTFGDEEGRDIWVAFRNDTRFSHLQQVNGIWHVEDLLPENGFGPGKTYFIKRDSRGWLWRGATDGVHVSDGTHLAADEWLHIDHNRGLGGDEIDQYGFFEDGDGSIWISSEEGVSHLEPSPDWFLAPEDALAPRITRVVSDDEDRLLNGQPGELRISSGTKHLHLEVGSFTTAPFYDAPFFYRLPELFSDWRPADSGLIELGDLPDASYTLEVSYAGSREGSPVLSQMLLIGPAAPGFPWSWTLLFGGSSIVAFTAFRRTWLFQKWHYRYAKQRHRARARRAEQTSPASPGYAQGEQVRDRYRVVKQLAYGGFSRVFEAVDEERKTSVALKVLERRISDYPWVKDRFAHEIAALRLIDHPGVVPVIDSWIADGGWPHIVEDLVPGITLRSALDDGPLSNKTVASLIRQIGEILAEIHRCGVVHRDLKPENIMLAPEDAGMSRPVLIDFGNAGFHASEDGMQTTKLLTGSLEYMAPEQLSHHYGPASDTYAFSVVIMEMLAGIRPAEFDTPIGTAAFERKLAGILERKDLRRSSELARLLLKGFAPNPNSRPVDVAGWATALSGLVEADGGR